MFYPAERDALRALIADVRARARPDGGVAPKVVIAPHAGLVYSGSVAATAFGPWTRRAEPPRRIVIVGPAHRVAFSGIAVHPASKLAHAARRGSCCGCHACRARPGARNCRRPAAVRGRAFARNAFDHAPGDAAGAVRNRAASGRRRGSRFGRGGAAPGLGRAGRSSQFRPTCRIFSIRRARARSIRTSPGASRRSTPPRSMAVALAASWPSRRRSRSPPSATCA